MFVTAAEDRELRSIIILLRYLTYVTAVHTLRAELASEVYVCHL